jgi:hypothetical protein
MTEDAPAVPTIEQASLEAIVRDLLGEPQAVLATDWTCEPLGGGASEAAVGLYWVTGSACAGASTRSWSLVLKVCADEGDDPGAWDYPPRERLIYGSGLLEALPGGLAVPRCLAVEKRPDKTSWLWLEAIHDQRAGPWPLEHFLVAARCLGRFNGAYLAGTPVPDQSWLSRGWLRGFIEPSATAMDDLNRLTIGQPELLRLYPPPVAAGLLRLWNERELFLDALDRLPRTFCHHDAFRRNLLTRQGPQGEELVALDWACAGEGGVGEELAALVLGSLVFFEAEAFAPRELAAACFGAYVSGLRQAGWKGDERLARLGFTAAAALRYTIGTHRLMLPGIATPATYPLLESLLNRPIQEIVDGWANLFAFQFQLAEEARSLIPLVT